MLVWIAWASLGLAFACASIIVLDEVRHPQSMAVMNAVWPATALYLSVIALWWYFRAGRGMAKDAPGRKMGGDHKPPTLSQVALAASHCGAGCALADIGTEFALFALRATIAASTLVASYVWDFVGAWSLGILFQYFSIKPMRSLSPAAGIAAAIKADTLSILAFQVGMYAWMAISYYKLNPHSHLEPNSPVYWLSMQVGMICGFLTAMPMNRMLVSWGWKEKMG